MNYVLLIIPACAGMMNLDAKSVSLFSQDPAAHLHRA
jgi:hypothetical protein